MATKPTASVGPVGRSSPQISPLGFAKSDNTAIRSIRPCFAVAPAVIYGVRSDDYTLVLMRSPTALLVAAIATVVAAPAWAHGEGALIAPAAWGGLGIGAVAGALAGYKGSHPGVALGWGIGLLFLALVAWAGFEGELLLGALLYLFIVPFAGAIPLAIAFFVTFAATVFLRERFFPADAPPTNEH